MWLKRDEVVKDHVSLLLTGKQQSTTFNDDDESNNGEKEKWEVTLEIASRSHFPLLRAGRRTY
jgi:hypothetical protein